MISATDTAPDCIVDLVREGRRFAAYYGLSVEDDDVPPDLDVFAVALAQVEDCVPDGRLGDVTWATIEAISDTIIRPLTGLDDMVRLDEACIYLALAYGFNADDV